VSITLVVPPSHARAGAGMGVTTASSGSEAITETGASAVASTVTGSFSRHLEQAARSTAAKTTSEPRVMEESLEECAAERAVLATKDGELVS
jgi:hypothetical protein